MSPLRITLAVGATQLAIVVSWACFVDWAIPFLLFFLLVWLPCIIPAAVCSRKAIVGTDKSWVSLLAVASGVFMVWMYLAVVVKF